MADKLTTEDVEELGALRVLVLALRVLVLTATVATVVEAALILK